MPSTRSSQEDNKYLVPDAWVTMMNDRVLTPYVKPDQVVITDELVQEFETLDTRARAHAIARGEHDALIYLHIYAIWNNSSWRARYSTFEDYCDEWDKMPMGVSKSSIKHKLADIKKLLALGVTTETIIRTLGNVPMATRSLLEEAFDDNGKAEPHANRKFLDKLPHGTDVDAYLQELAQLGPIQANLAVDELRERHNIYIEDDVEYDAQTKRLFFRVVSNHPKTGVLATELFIPNVPDHLVRFMKQILLRRRNV